MQMIECEQFLINECDKIDRIQMHRFLITVWFKNGAVKYINCKNWTNDECLCLIRDLNKYYNGSWGKTLSIEEKQAINDKLNELGI